MKRTNVAVTGRGDEVNGATWSEIGRVDGPTKNANNYY